MQTSFEQFKNSLNEGKKADKQYKKDVAAYKFFVVNISKKKVESGYEFKNDAKDALSDFDGDKNYKVVTEKELDKLGIKNPKEKWMNENVQPDSAGFNINDVKYETPLYDEILSFGFTDSTSDIQHKRGVLEFTAISSEVRRKYKMHFSGETPTPIQYVIYPNGKLRTTDSGKSQHITSDIGHPLESLHDVEFLMGKLLRSAQRIGVNESVRHGVFPYFTVKLDTLTATFSEVSNDLAQDAVLEGNDDPNIITFCTSWSRGQCESVANDVIARLKAGEPKQAIVDSLFEEWY